ncbi:hypothetical protein F4859DRAFT_512091 [Xylaria cf. heliscus]|nr:hypothetical protein F4859DRAFT_512091 [Xylaria cf. heliscus]
MKASFLTFFAIGGFIASSIANPIAVSGSVAKRQDDDDLAALGATLETLLSNIQEQTAIINATLNAVPDTLTDAEAAANAEKIAPQLQVITDLLTATDSGVTSKRALVATGYSKPDLFKIISHIIYELLFTVKIILIKLGLVKVVIFLKPLVLSLKGLLYKLDLVVGGLLYAVASIANELLKAVGVALIGLT